MKDRTLRVKSVKLNSADRKLVAQLQRRLKLSFSDLVRTGLQKVKSETEKEAVA